MAQRWLIDCGSFSTENQENANDNFTELFQGTGFPDIGGDATLRLIGEGQSVLLINTPFGGALYGEDIDETYSLGAFDPIDNSGLIQRFLYGFFKNLVSQTVIVTNADGSDTAIAVQFNDDGHIRLGSGREVVAEASVTMPALVLTAVAFADLGTAVNGTMVYCSDCLPNSNPASGSSTGAIAKRLNGIWRCD